MAETVFRRNPTPGSSFSSTVYNRSQLLKGAQTIGGQSIQMINPAWIKITGKCNMCTGGLKNPVTLPKEKGDWDSIYKSNGLKPDPILEDVTLTYGGDWGLAQKLTANIKCFDRDTFDYVRKAFLMPGNEISAQFGYSTSKQWNSQEQSSRSVKGFRVATFSFSAGDDGTWVGSFVAVSSAEAIKSVDILQGLSSEGLKYKIAGKVEGENTLDVKSIAELIISDTQRNGKDSVPRVGATNTGYVISDFASYDATDPTNMKASMVVYTGKHLEGRSWGDIGGAIGGFWGRVVGNYFDDIPHQTYVTLGYIVDRVFNDKILKSAKESVKGGDGEKFKKLLIKFHKDYSISKLPRLIQSGDPTAVLILGAGIAVFKDEGDVVMDFNDLKEFEGSSKPEDVTALLADNFISLDKILIHREVFLAALSAASNIPEPESTTVDPKDTSDTLIDVNNAFRKLFAIIGECTGGALALRLVQDPDDEARETLLVVDQNYGGTPIPKLKCFVFDPINGDGSTISCNISSNGGSNEYRTSMFLANSKKGDTAARLRNCESDLNAGRELKHKVAVWRKNELILQPGSIAKDHFNQKQMDAFKSVMVDLYRNSDVNHIKTENVNWPGVGIDLTIRGAWGIIPGCAIATTQFPSSWSVKNVYFMVTEVSHNFKQSTWTTQVRGIMSFYDSLQRVFL